MNSLCLSPGDFFFYRQAHGVAFGKSDLFFLCLLKPLSSDIVVQETEIAAAKVCYKCEALAKTVLSMYMMMMMMAFGFV